MITFSNDVLDNDFPASGLADYLEDTNSFIEKNGVLIFQILSAFSSGFGQAFAWETSYHQDCLGSQCQGVIDEIFGPFLVHLPDVSEESFDDVVPFGQLVCERAFLGRSTQDKVDPCSFGCHVDCSQACKEIDESDCGPSSVVTCGVTVAIRGMFVLDGGCECAFSTS